MESYRSNSRSGQERRNRRNRGEMQWGRRTDYERDVVDPFEGQEPVEQWDAGDPDRERWRSAQDRYPARGQSRFDRGFEDFEDWQRPPQFGQNPYAQNPYSRNPYTSHGPQRYGSERFGTRQPFGSGRYQGESEHLGREREFESGYAGKGPKGYQRSDERIREDLSDRLTADADIDASDISITVNHGEVTLEGSIRDRTMKRATEDLSEEIAGVREVNNRLRVEKRDPSSSGDDSGRSRSAQSSLPTRGGEWH